MEIARSAAAKIEAASPNLKDKRVLSGFDGFVDEIVWIVDERQSVDKFKRIETISALGDRIKAAAGESANIELVVQLEKLGGNGPIMANAQSASGLSVTYIGNLGYPAIHSVFQPMTAHMNVKSVAEPGHTDALEFTDGKLMLGKREPLKQVSWSALKSQIGLDAITKEVDGADLVASVNWTMLPYMNTIWEGMLTEVLPNVSKKQRRFFFDLADPAMRTESDLRDGLYKLAQFRLFGETILGLNQSESEQVAKVLGISAEGNEAVAEAIRTKLGIHCVVVHPRESASAAIEGEAATFLGPFTADPAISTGAGDHFNAGFCLGRLLGMSIAESLCVGTATSGFYVRTTSSPTADQLATFLRELPPPA